MTTQLTTRTSAERRILTEIRKAAESHRNNKKQKMFIIRVVGGIVQFYSVNPCGRENNNPGLDY